MNSEKPPSNQPTEPYYNSWCPKCGSFNINHSDWSDNEFLWITYYCNNCDNKWREKIDLNN